MHHTRANVSQIYARHILPAILRRVAASFNTGLSDLLEDNVLFFVHGFNVSDASAIEVWTKELYARLVRSGYEGDIVVLNWRGDEKPASGGWLKKKADYYELNVENAVYTGKVWAEIVLAIRDAKPSADLDVAGHSLGNRVMLEGLGVAMSKGLELDVDDVLHFQAAVDDNVYYQARQGFSGGTFSAVSEYVDQIYNFTSIQDQVLQGAYSGNAGLLGKSGTGHALGIRKPPMSFFLPPDFHNIETERMGISGHSKMMERQYREVRYFWETVTMLLMR